MKRTLQDAARRGRRTIGRRGSSLRCRGPRTAARSSPVRCSSRCAGPTSTAGSSSRPRRRSGAIGAIVEARGARMRCRRSWSRMRCARCRQLGQALARSNSPLPVVAVGGSNGKTTAKEMTAAILSRMGRCMATHGNLNNHIGVPVTLMRLEASHRSAVVEMGANRIGDVAELVRLARPTVGLITNAGAEHLEGFGNLDGVAAGRGGDGVLPRADAPPPSSMPTMPTPAIGAAVATARRIVTFGVHADADFMAKNSLQAIERGEFATRFTLECPLGAARDHAQGGRRAQHRQCAGARRPRPAPPAPPSRKSPPGLRTFARCRAACSSRPGRATAGSSTIPTTPIRVRCAPASRCCARCRARPGWCSATWRSSASIAEDSHAHMGAMRAIAASSACSRWGRRARARSRPSVRAPSGSRTPIP